MKLELKNMLPEIERLAAAVEEFGAENGLSDRAVFNINLVLEEIVANIISYGYNDNREHIITIECTLAGQNLVMEVRDDAKAFNPLEAKKPDLDKPLEEREIGGLGIFLVRKFMDTVEYRREEPLNILRLMKNISTY